MAEDKRATVSHKGNPTATVWQTEPESGMPEAAVVVTWYPGSNTIGVQQEEVEILLNTTTLKRLAAIADQLMKQK